MQMNKNQVTMAVIGGVALAVALVLGGLIFLVEADKQEEAQRNLSNQTNAYNQNKNATEEQQAAHQANAEVYAKAAADAYAAITAKDARAYVGRYTEEKLLQAMQQERDDYVNKQFIKPEFTFGKYFGDRMKNIEAKDKETVQRRWGDISQLSQLLFEGGVQSLDEVEVLEPEQSAANDSGADEEKVDAYPIETETYELTFTATSEALVNVLNAFASANRFISVDMLTFQMSKDPIKAKFGIADKGAESGVGRRRRSRATAESADEGAEKKQGSIITDPEQEQIPFKVTLRLSTLTAVKREQPAEKEVE